MSSPHFYKTGTLARFILRRDRIRIPVWVIAFFLVTLATSVAFTGLYASHEERQAMAEVMINPAMTAMVGTNYGIDNYTIGAMMAHQMLVITALVVAIMSILLVVRYTRTEEEDGRFEMIRALPTGRLSQLGATMSVMCGIQVLLALLIGIGLYILNIESMNLQGSLMYGASLGAIGLFFTSLTAVFAQLSNNSRGTIGLAFAALGVAYMLRAIGDVSNEILTWLSPLGWIQNTQAYVNNFWWPLILTVGISLVLIVFAFYLNAKRDVGSGILPSKPGRMQASLLLLRPIGLAFRLQRTSIIAWAFGMFLLGASYGSILGDTEAFFADNEMLQEFLNPIEGISLNEQYIAMLMSVVSIMCTIPALIFIFKLKGEENKHRTEYLLGSAVSRSRIIGSYFAISFVGGVVLLTLSSIGMGIASMAVMEDGVAFSTFVSAGLVYLPAMWIMIGLATVFVGVAPKLTGLSWLYLIFSFFLVYLGGLFQFPDWISKTSPYSHIPQVPIEDIDFIKLSFMTIIALVLIVIGYIGYNKRDIQG